MNLTIPARTLRDLGGAAWFGGALMGATGLNAAGDAAGAAGADRDAVVSTGWARWTPVFRAAALAHLAGRGTNRAVHALEWITPELLGIDHLDPVATNSPTVADQKVGRLALWFRSSPARRIRHVRVGMGRERTQDRAD
jgi:hypothetical protein